MNFKVGQKVVCVCAFKRRTIGEITPVNGQTYTVRAEWTSDEQYIQLEEIHNPRRYYVEGFDECGFSASGFRPVIEDLTAQLARTESDRIVEEKPDHINVPELA